jgi:hypothetical protein
MQNRGVHQRPIIASQSFAFSEKERPSEPAAELPNHYTGFFGLQALSSIAWKSHRFTPAAVRRISTGLILSLLRLEKMPPIKK